MNNRHVVHAHSGNLFGGIESMLVTLARMSQHTVRHEFALTVEGRLARELRAAGSHVTMVGSVRFSRPWTVRRARRALTERLIAAPPHGIVCHAPWSLAALAPAAVRAGVPLVAWLHAPPAGRHWLERLARRRRPRLVICNSQYTAASARTLFPQVPTVVVYPPVPRPAVRAPEVRHKIREQLGVPHERVIIVQVSRLEAWKGHRVLLAALATLTDREDWECWIVGGPQRPAEARYLARLEHEAVQSGLSTRVRFLGQREDVPQLLAAADVLCQPNLRPEPFGVVFVEALYAGLPVVTTGAGGAAEIVTRATGILTPPGDARAVAVALRSLLADPSLRGALGAAGPARAAQLCDPDRQAARLAAALDALRAQH